MIAWIFVGPLQVSGDSNGGHTCAEEESNQRKDHLVTKIFAKEKHAKHNSDGDETQDGHGILDDLQDPAEFLDIAGELLDELTGECIRPKAVFALTECDLQPNILCLMAVFFEIIEGMLKGGRASLDSVVHP